MDAKQLAQDVLNALKELMVLEIVTTVGTIDVDLAANSKQPTFANLDPEASAITRINIATGDIWTNRTRPVDLGFDIGDYHEKMVEKSQAIIERNVKLITETIDKLRTVL